MGVLGTLGRIGLGVGTGGLSELVPAALGSNNGLAGIGHTDYTAAGYDPNADNFKEPLGGTGGTQSMLLGRALDTGPSTPAPQTGFVQPIAHAQAAPAPVAMHVSAPAVSSAIPQSFNPAFTAPGIQATQGAIQQAGESRGLELQNLSGLSAAANGQVPSAAEAQQRAGLASILRNNLALAASSRGTAANQVATARAALDRNSDASLQASGQAAALRASEQATARGQLTDAMGNIRAQDISGGGLGLGLGQIGLGAGTAQLGSNTQIALGDLGSRTQLAGAQIGSDTAINLGNANNATQLSGAQLNADTSANNAQLASETAIKQANLNAILQNRQMDDNMKAQYLAAAMGIDTRTQEGAIALERLKAQVATQTQATNANIATGNATATANLVGNAFSGIGTALA